MIIDVYKLKQQGKTDEDLTMEYLPERPLIDLPNAHIEGPVSVRVTVHLTGKNAYVEGTVNYTVAGECSRCLEDASVYVTEPFEAEYGVTSDFEYPVKSGTIDLTVPVEEAIIMSSPMVIYCREDCKGFCPTCGANLNETKCNCKN